MQGKVINGAAVNISFTKQKRNDKILKMSDLTGREFCCGYSGNRGFNNPKKGQAEKIMVKREDILKYTMENYEISPVRLWEKTPTNEVWRHENNGKWFAIIMDIPGNRVGLDEDTLIDVMNVKCEPEMVSLLVSQPGFAPAYHMNKTHWISIILNGTAPDETVYQLLDMSYDLTAGHKRG